LIIDNPLFEEEHQSLVAVLLILENLAVAQSLVIQLLNCVLFDLLNPFQQSLYINVKAADATLGLHIVQVVDLFLGSSLHQER
jgi:hypothetical protein